MHKQMTYNGPERPFNFFWGWHLFLAILLTFFASWAHSDTVIDIPPGQTNLLVDAIQAANGETGTTTIRLAEFSEYPFGGDQQFPPPISSHIVLHGRGSHLVGDETIGNNRLIDITEQGIFEVSNLVVREFHGVQMAGLIYNAGELVARDLRIENITSQASDSFSGAVVQNFGALDFGRVRMVDLTVSGSAEHRVVAIDNGGVATLNTTLIVDGGASGPETTSAIAYLHNFQFGTMEVLFSTFARSSETESTISGVNLLERTLVRPGVYPIVSLRASMVIGLGCPFDEVITSEGFNLISDQDCASDRGNDVVGDFPRAVQFQEGPDGSLVGVIPSNSPALDRVHNDNFACPSRDARSGLRPVDGNNDSIARCDIGAFESLGGRHLFSGGENGLYFSAESDGHYVTLHEVRPNEYVIYWNTFDLNGNQAWVLALGQLDGDVITAEAYFQPEGQLVPGAGPVVNTAEIQDWGTINIQLFDCLEGNFQYSSNLPQFGSGAFPLDRLAITNGLGCRPPIGAAPENL